MEEDWCSDKLSELRVAELRLGALMEIHSRLNEDTDNLDNMICRLLSSPELFQCLDGGNKCSWEENTEHAKLANEIIIICLQRLKIDTSQAEMATVLRRSLIHPRSSIRSIAFDCLLKEFRNQASLCDVQPLPQSDLLFFVIDELKRPDTDCGVSAIGILTIALGPHIGEPEIQQALSALLREDEHTRCRVYEVAVKIGKRSASSLNLVEFILDASIAELQNDDVLVQANVLEILVALAEQNHGLVYLERRKVFDLLSDRIKYISEDSLDHILVPCIMKFFGKIARMHPQKMINEYQHMVMCLFENLISADPSLLPVSMDTLANLAYSPQGKLILDEQYPISIREVFETYAAHLKNLPIDLKIRLVNTLETIYYTENTISEEVSEVLRKWLRYLTGGSKMQLMLDYCRLPFNDLKIACLSFVKAVCIYAWGVESLKKTAGFVEYLLDRRLESDKDVKYLKWEIIKKLADSNVFDVQTQLQLTRYVNDGAHFESSELNVAVERTD